MHVCRQQVAGINPVVLHSHPSKLAYLAAAFVYKCLMCLGCMLGEALHAEPPC